MAPTMLTLPYIIVWTNIDLLSIWFCGTHLGAFSSEMLYTWFTKIYLKIAYVKL